MICNILLGNYIIWSRFEFRLPQLRRQSNNWTTVPIDNSGLSKSIIQMTFIFWEIIQKGGFKKLMVGGYELNHQKTLYSKIFDEQYSILVLLLCKCTWSFEKSPIDANKVGRVLLIVHNADRKSAYFQTFSLLDSEFEQKHILESTFKDQQQCS